MKTQFTPEFQIVKPGTTDGAITIMSKAGEPFDRDAKIEKYLSLSYTVIEQTK
jgi:hypothetical protein